jgi:hypothetical protein
MIKDNMNKNQFDMMQALIDMINSGIKALRENNIAIKDHDDIEYCINYICYSPAKDEVFVKFEEVEEDDI